MAYDVIHKNSTVAGTPPTAGEIEIGEIAINAADADLYTKDTNGAVNTFSNNATIATKAAFTQSGTGAVQRTIAAKLQDVVSVKDFGAVGDGVTDDTAAIQAAIASLSDNSLLFFPGGSYRAVGTNTNTASSGDTVNNALFLIQNKSNITLTGPGKIKSEQGGTKRYFTFVFKNCSNCSVKDLTIEGDMVRAENVPNSETDAAYGVYFYNCSGSKLTGSSFNRLIIPFLVTGQGRSPATVADVSIDTIISGNVFDYFEQNSTFGAGAQNLVITGNIFRNCYCATKLSQHPLNDPSAVNKGGNIVWSNNTVSWDPTFEFSEVWWSPGKSQVPYGLQIQSCFRRVICESNVIDMSGCRALTLPPILESQPIVQLTSEAALTHGEEFTPEDILISNNVLVQHPTENDGCIKLTTYSKNTDIIGNKCTGFISAIGSGGNDTFVYGALTIKSNTVLNDRSVSAAQISVTGGNYKSVTIADNTLKGDAGVLVLGDQETLFLNGVKSTSLSVSGNVLPAGRIGSYGATASTIEYLSITGNQCRGIDLSTDGLKRASITGNTCVTNGTAIKLVLDATSKANCRTQISGNTCTGETNSVAATAVNLNGGSVRLESNSFDANANSSFVFDSSVAILSGNYYGNGAPTQSAQFGTTYINYGVTSNAIYMKTTVSGTSGWVQVH